jgi:hypothetical protein
VLNFKLKLCSKRKSGLKTVSMSLVLIFYVGVVYNGCAFLVYIDRSLKLTLKMCIGMETCFQLVVMDYLLRSDDGTYAVICNHIMPLYI